MKKRVTVLLLSLCILLPFVATAQENPAPEPTVEVTAIPTSEPPIVADEPPAPTAPIFTAPAFNDALQAFMAALVAIFATAIASPLTASLVSLLKRIPALANVQGNVLNIVVAVLLSAVLWLGQVFGFAGQVDTAFKFVYAVLPFLVGIGANYLSNAAVYSVAKKSDMPVIGYARSTSYSTGG